MRGIIFDLDGVIVDTAKYHYLGWKRLADEIGVEFDQKKNEALKGVSRRDSLIALLGYTPEESKIIQWCDLKNSYYLEYIENISTDDLLPGAIGLLEEISKNNSWKQALASSSKNAEIILEKLNLKKYFNAVVDGKEIEKTKPDPEIFKKAAAKLNILPENLVVFEDAQSGIKAAKDAGMLGIGIGDKELLSEADVVISDLSKINLKKIESLF